MLIDEAIYVSIKCMHLGRAPLVLPHLASLRCISIGCPHLSSELPLLTAPHPHTHTIPLPNSNFSDWASKFPPPSTPTNHQPTQHPRRQLEIAAEQPTRWVRYLCARHHIQVACVRREGTCEFPKRAPCCVLGLIQSLSLSLEIEALTDPDMSILNQGS